MIKELSKRIISALGDLIKATPSFSCAPITLNKYPKYFNIAMLADWPLFHREVTPVWLEEVYQSSMKSS
jgi:hypothetical protein